MIHVCLFVDEQPMETCTTLTVNISTPLPIEAVQYRADNIIFVWEQHQTKFRLFCNMKRSSVCCETSDKVPFILKQETKFRLFNFKGPHWKFPS